MIGLDERVLASSISVSTSECEFGFHKDSVWLDEVGNRITDVMCSGLVSSFLQVRAGMD